MKSYFVIRDFFSDSFNALATGIKLHSYKIDGVETLTTEFFAETQGLPYQPPLEIYAFCTANVDGANPQPNTANPTSFNPFRHDFRLVFPIVNGLPRGQATGTASGSNFGAGVLNFGVDIPIVHAADNTPCKGGFFIDIDYSKNVEIIFDVVTNNFNNVLYENPIVLKKYKLIWDVARCYREFSFYNFINQTWYDDIMMGFLTGDKEKPEIDFTDIPCGPDNAECPTKERTRSFALFVNIPPTDPDAETIKECCFNAVVLAQTGDVDYEKNDFTGMFHQRQVPGESCDFVLVNVNTSEEMPLVNQAFGVYKNFGSIPGNDNLKTFVLSWKKVLLAKGVGIYTLLKRVTIAGLVYEVADINYTLQQYTTNRADKTIRMDARTNGFMQRLGVDFKNSGFETSLRFGGFFGRREPKFNQDNIIYGDYGKTQISVIQENTYTMQSNPLPSCMTTQIWDFLLFANDIYFNDYNLNNHLRNFIKFPVVLAETKEPTYGPHHTRAVLNMTFTEKTGDNIKRNY